MTLIPTSISGLAGLRTLSSATPPPASSGGVQDRVSIGGALEKGIPGLMFGLLPAVGALTNVVGGREVPKSMHTVATVGLAANLIGLAGALGGMSGVAGCGLVVSAVCSGVVWAYRGAHNMR